jgi:serine/threonine-protein kinase HipA
VAKQSLGVWLYGTRIADIADGKPGVVTCRYTPEALDVWAGGTPLLSCSLPLSSRPFKDAGVWFRGLLPEGRALQAMADAARVPTFDTFGMLARFGRDVVGAAVIAAEPVEDRSGGIAPYDADTLAGEVADLDDRPLALHDDSELSLPGLQNKLLLVALEDGWGRPTGGRPSTHILKAEDRRYPGLAEREAACLHLARAVDLTPVDAWTETHANIACLVTSRFDRITDDNGTIVRLHQEDACQALGINHEANDRRGKYETHGGPSFAKIAGLLDRYAADPVRELEQLARAMAFTVAIGNADAHGKNIAVVHDSPETIRLAPVYDTVPMLCWDRLPTRAAMAVNGRRELVLGAPDTITVADLIAEARGWRLDEARAAEAVTHTLNDLAAAAGTLEIPREVVELVTARCHHLLDP